MEKDTLGMAALSAQYPNLFARVEQLHARLVCYHRFGTVRGDVPYGSGADVPAFSAVSFDPAQAARYERVAEKIYARRPHPDAEVPKPAFAVELTVDFGYGVMEPRTFDFRNYSDEAALTAFCAEICARAAEHFRHRRSGKR